MLRRSTFSRLTAALLIAPVLASTAQPAAARESSRGQTAEQRSAGELADRVNDPEMQARIASAMSAMTRALLAMPVGGFADAMRKVDPDAVPRNMPRDATLGDMVTRDRPGLERDLDGKVHQGTQMAGAMMGAMAQMLPAMKQAMRGVLEGMAEGMDPARD